MAVNKVVFGSNTIIDITDTTATASDVAQGKYFYTKAGVRTEGAASGKKYVARITSTGASGLTYVRYNNVTYYTAGDTFEFSQGDTLLLHADGRTASYIEIDNVVVSSAYPASYTYTLPNHRIDITLEYSGTGYVRVKDGSTINITENGTYDIDGYDIARVDVSASTLITKSITANGTYDAEDDSADGYSSVMVNVSGGGGGASNFITGTFKGTTTGAAMDVNIPYTGTGYPIAAMIYVTGGAYDSAGEGSTFYNAVQRYAIAQWTMSKSRMAEVPTYTGNTGANNYGVVAWIYKNSASSANQYSRASTMNTANAYYNANATATNNHTATFKSATKMSVFIASTSYGFMANVEYTYHVIYSS